ncbi:MAG: flippase-like domain-containing protein [Bacteroidales bacterium]|nr:flippase-like domain-containing protein [Bacteroidales bacterium]
MKNTQLLKSILKFSFFLGLGIFITWWFVRDLSAEYRELIFESFRNANYGFVGIALIFGLLSFWIRAKRWKMQFQPMNYFPKTKNVLMAVMVGYFANLAFPRLGEVVRCGLLDKHEKIPTVKSIGTVITERILDMLCFGILLLLTLALQFERLSNYAMENFSGLYAKFTNPEFVRNVIFLSIFGILAFGFFIFFLRKKIAHTRLYRRMKIVILQLKQGLISLKNMEKRGLFIVYTIALWACYYLMAYIVFFAVVETSNLPMAAGLACLVFGTIGIVITPGGIGIYPVIIANTLLLYGITEPIGFALGWLIWASQNAVVVIGGLASLVLMPMINRARRSQTPDSTKK